MNVGTLGWNSVHKISNHTRSEGTPQFFSGELGLVKKFKANIQVKPDVQLKFTKPGRSNPACIRRCDKGRAKEIRGKNINISVISQTRWSNSFLQ